MADLDNATKLKLESILEMRGGYVLDLSNATFADFVRTSIGFDPYGKYGEGHSKARLLRLIWEQEPNAAVAKLNLDLLERWRVSKLSANEVPSAAQESLRQELAQHFAQQTETESAPATGAAEPVSFTTEASVTANKIEIEIHEDIYGHIGQYLATGDYFHAVEESYKLVREKLREITGKEKASDAFNNSAQNTAHYHALFGKRRLRATLKPTSSEASDTCTWVFSICETRRLTPRRRRSTPTSPSTTSRWRASPTT